MFRIRTIFKEHLAVRIDEVWLYICRMIRGGRLVGDAQPRLAQRRSVCGSCHGPITTPLPVWVVSLQWRVVLQSDNLADNQLELPSWEAQINHTRSTNLNESHLFQRLSE